METVLVEIKNERAYSLLKDLEDLQLIRVLPQPTAPAQTLADKYAGKLPAAVADELQEYVRKSRDACGR